MVVALRRGKYIAFTRGEIRARCLRGLSCRIARNSVDRDRSTYERAIIAKTKTPENEERKRVVSTVSTFGRVEHEDRGPTVSQGYAAEGIDRAQYGVYGASEGISDSCC